MLGINCNYTDEALSISRKNKFVKIIKKNYNSLKYFFENYDLIISSGGLSMYEQIYCRTNSLIIPQNKYQKKICYNFDNYCYEIIFHNDKEVFFNNLKQRTFELYILSTSTGKNFSRVSAVRVVDKAIYFILSFFAIRLWFRFKGNQIFERNI